MNRAGQERAGTTQGSVALPEGAEAAERDLGVGVAAVLLGERGQLAQELAVLSVRETATQHVEGFIPRAAPEQAVRFHAE